MKLLLYIGLALASGVSLLPANGGEQTETLPDPQKIFLTGTCGDRMTFAPGEPMVFTLTPDFQGQKTSATYFVEWKRIGDDGKKQSGREKVSPGNGMTIKTSLDKPGFVRIDAVLLDKNGGKIMKKDKKGRPSTIFFAGGAGVDIDRLKGVPEPADFDSFWKKQKAKLEKIPLKYLIKKTVSNQFFEIYAVSVDCAGPRPVTGYLSIPAGAKKKSLPAVVQYPAYGIVVQQAPHGGRRNQITFTINAHGYKLGESAEYYRDFFKGINGNKYAFDETRCTSPETAYFNGMALRVMRSLQFVKALPQWDGTNLQVQGISQGGLQAIWAAALDSDVSFATVSIPWGCDLGGISQGRFAGWRKKYFPALDYFDPVNHAKRIRCPVEIRRAGLGDKTSPPAGVTILYNNISAPKKITYIQGSEHGYVPPNPQVFTKENNHFSTNPLSVQ